MRSNLTEDGRIGSRGPVRLSSKKPHLNKYGRHKDATNQTMPDMPMMKTGKRHSVFLSSGYHEAII